MKFGYEGAREEELIRNYKINESKIIITFLDGSFHEVPLTEGAENDLLDRMIKQAQERDESMEMGIAIRERRGALLWAMYLGMVDLIYINATINANTDMGRILETIFSGIIGLTIVLNGLVCKIRNDEINELKKYAIYLHIKDRLKEVEDRSILGLKGKERQLNINTLDDYSLRDIKKISQGLEGVKEEFGLAGHSSFDDSSKKNVFAKRRGN